MYIHSLLHQAVGILIFIGVRVKNNEIGNKCNILAASCQHWHWLSWGQLISLQPYVVLLAPK